MCRLATSLVSLARLARISVSNTSSSESSRSSISRTNLSTATIRCSAAKRSCGSRAMKHPALRKHGDARFAPLPKSKKCACTLGLNRWQHNNPPPTLPALLQAALEFPRPEHPPKSDYSGLRRRQAMARYSWGSEALSRKASILTLSVFDVPSTRAKGIVLENSNKLRPANWERFSVHLRSLKLMLDHTPPHSSNLGYPLENRHRLRTTAWNSLSSQGVPR
jgi:hypothetical protein